MQENIRLVGTIANLITFTHNNKEYLVTNHEIDIVSNNRIFRSIYMDVGKIKASALRVRAELEIELNVENDIADLINSAESSDKIKVRLEKCYSENPNDILTIWWGMVSDNVTNDLKTKITCTPANLDFEKQTSVYTYMNKCNNTLSKGTCTVLLDNFIFQATVLDILDGGLTLTLSRTSPQNFTQPENQNYLQMGAIKKGREIKTIIRSVNSTTSSNIQLKQKIKSLKIGDVVDLIPGCDGRSATCKVKFNNFKDYIGFENVPGTNPFKKLA